MKKMIVLTSLWSFLFIFSFSMFGCSEDDDEFGTTAERGNEVRTPRVEEINGKAVVTWIDPYITDIKEVQVKDLQTNEQQTVAKGCHLGNGDLTLKQFFIFRHIGFHLLHVFVLCLWDACTRHRARSSLGAIASDHDMCPG